MTNNHSELSSLIRECLDYEVADDKDEVLLAFGHAAHMIEQRAADADTAASLIRLNFWDLEHADAEQWEQRFAKTRDTIAESARTFGVEMKPE